MTFLDILFSDIRGVKILFYNIVKVTLKIFFIEIFINSNPQNDLALLKTHRMTNKCTFFIPIYWYYIFFPQIWS